MHPWLGRCWNFPCCCITQDGKMCPWGYISPLPPHWTVLLHLCPNQPSKRSIFAALMQHRENNQRIYWVWMGQTHLPPLPKAIRVPFSLCSRIILNFLNCPLFDHPFTKGLCEVLEHLSTALPSTLLLKSKISIEEPQKCKMVLNKMSKLWLGK